MNESNELLSKIRRISPELCAEEAFVVPAWFWQQQSWVQDPIKSDNAIYNFPLAIRIRGPLHIEAFQQSLQQIVQRHDVLRSVFRVMNGELVQIVVPIVADAIPMVDLSEPPARSAHELEARARQIAVNEARQPFALSRGPLLRTTLFRLDREDHVFLLTTHHLVYDDWSTGILMRELGELYAARMAGRPCSLPALSFTYGDFARWQRRKMQGKELESGLDFWKRELAGGKDFHHLPTDRPRSKCRSNRGNCVSAIVPEDLTGSLRTLSQQERVSLFMTMLAAFQCLLYEYSGDQDIAVGSCAANRSLVQVEGLIGRFGNDLVLRTDLTGNPTFRKLLARVRTTSLTAFSYHDLPFGRIVEELQSGQTSARNPVFQVMFILQDAPKASTEVSGLTLTSFPLELGTAKYDLNVWLRPRHQGLEVVFEYDTDLFAVETMARMLDRYQRLLAAIPQIPDVRIAELSVPKRAREAGRGVHEIQPNLARTSDDVQAKLVEIWESILGHRPIGVTTDYFQLGGTSLQASVVFTKIEEAFGVKLSLSTLLHATTIQALSEAICRSGAAASWSRLVEIQHGGSRPPFFCVHGAGGNFLKYRDLARHLGPDQPFYVLQSQGLDGEQSFLTRIEDMAALYIKEIQGLQPGGPYFLGGSCGGGTIALEKEKKLHAQGQKVPLLALFDCYNWAKLKLDSRLDAFCFYLQTALFCLGNFFSLDSKDKLKRLQKKRQAFKGKIGLWPSILVDKLAKNTRRGIHQSFPLDQLYDVNALAVLDYVPKIYPGRIYHFCPIRQCARYNRPELGWDALAAGGVETFVLLVYPGGMLAEPFVRHLAAKLRTCIETLTESQYYPTVNQIGTRSMKGLQRE